MKQLLLTLFLAVAIVAAAPLDNNADPVQLIVNGAPQGEPIDLGDIVNLKLKEKVNGEVISSSDLLYPLSSQAFAETAAAAALEDASQDVVADILVLPDLSKPEVVLEPEVIPDPIALPAPAAPAVIPEPMALPAPVAPEVVPEPIALPAPAAPAVADSENSNSPVIVVPSPAIPGQPPQPAEEEILPSPYSQHIYNDGIVSVEVNNADTNLSYLEQIQNWAHVVINYFFNDGLRSSEIH